MSEKSKYQLSADFGRRAAPQDIVASAFYGKDAQYLADDAAYGCLLACEEGNFKNMGAMLKVLIDVPNKDPTHAEVNLMMTLGSWFTRLSPAIENAQKQGKSPYESIAELTSGITIPESREYMLGGIMSGAIEHDCRHTLAAAAEAAAPETKTRALANGAPGMTESHMHTLYDHGGDLAEAARRARDSGSNGQDHADRLTKLGLYYTGKAQYDAACYGTPEDVAATEAAQGQDHSRSIRLGAIDKALQGRGFDNLKAALGAADQRDPHGLPSLWRHEVRDIATALDRTQVKNGDAAEVIGDILGDVRETSRRKVQNVLLSQIAKMDRLAVPEQLMHALHMNNTDFAAAAEGHPQAAMLKRMDGLFTAIDQRTRAAAAKAAVTRDVERSRKHNLT